MTVPGPAFHWAAAARSVFADVYSRLRLRAGKLIQVHSAVVAVEEPWAALRTAPVSLPEHLAEFTEGEREGTVEAPVHLYWSGEPGQKFDLASDSDAATWYSAVIYRGSPAEQVRYLNGVRLAEVWTITSMPWKTRMDWESRYPELRAIRRAALAAERNQGLPTAA